MSKYKERSDYFKMLANNNKLIAHNRPIDGSNKNRKSFYRVNDLDELNAACVNWAHFPCMVHVGHDILFKQPGTGLPRKVIGNHLYFLSKTKAKNLADEMEAAYTESEEAMSQILSYMNEEMEAGHRCGNLFLFDLKGAHAEQIGPFNTVLYGWHLVFYDETRACDLGYKSIEWFTPMVDGEDSHCGCNKDDEAGNSSSDAEIIFFNDESSVVIEMTTERIARLGQMPQVQVWFQDDDDANNYNVARVPIEITGAPSNVTAITVYNTGDADGFITLKRTVSDENNTSGEIIPFDNQTSVFIEMTPQRIATIGQVPQAQVWFQDEDDENNYNAARVPVQVTGAPSNVTAITVYNTGNADGFITLKRTLNDIGDSCGEIILFDNQPSVIIEITTERIATLGQMPQVQVWFQDEDDSDNYNVARVPIKTTGTPPNISSIAVYTTGNSNGFITLKKTV